MTYWKKPLESAELCQSTDVSVVVKQNKQNPIKPDISQICRLSFGKQ